MNRAARYRGHSARSDDIAAPLSWTFDGSFAHCLVDAENTLRRAIVQLGDVAGLAVAVDLSLPALAARIAAGDAIQPAWSGFLSRMSKRYGLPCTLRIRHRNLAGPLLTLAIAYRS